MKHQATPVSRETMERLRVFEALLQRWQDRINLVARGDRSEIWHRHIDDSLQLCEWLPEVSTPAIDLGSGAGFPGLVLAIASDIPFHLVEADKRKAAFLREAARVTETAVTVHDSRIADAQLPEAALLTARGLAPLPRLLDLAALLINEATVCLFPKGREWPSELIAADQGWRMKIERFPSRVNAEGAILRLSGIRRA